MDYGDDPLPEWGPMVLAYASPRLEAPLGNLLRFDGKLSRLVAGVSEPTLGQVRLAWWRNELSRDRQDGNASVVDPLLSSLLATWDGYEQALVAMVDAWEELLTERPWSEGVSERFQAGHAKAFAALSGFADGNENGLALASHGSEWARAKFALLSDGLAIPGRDDLPRLPRDFRAVAMIGGLSRRALDRGGKPLFGDRFSPLAALRLGIFGR